jgi:hypothetical protein
LNLLPEENSDIGSKVEVQIVEFLKFEGCRLKNIVRHISDGARN